MINGNRLKFGYGDIAVGSDGLTQRMSFRQFKPPAKCGDQVLDDIEYIGDEIILKFSYEDYCEFSKKLEQVYNKETAEFIFKGYVFDFTNFNEESIKVCKKHLNGAMQYYFMCMAA